MELKVFTRKEALEKARSSWLYGHFWPEKFARGARAPSVEWIDYHFRPDGWRKECTYRLGGELVKVDPEWIYRQLMKIPDTFKEDDIIPAFGEPVGETIYLLRCDECERSQERVVLFDKGCDECGGIYLCFDCLQKAMILLEPTPDTHPEMLE